MNLEDLMAHLSQITSCLVSSGLIEEPTEGVEIFELHPHSEPEAQIRIKFAGNNATNFMLALVYEE